MAEHPPLYQGCVHYVDMFMDLGGGGGEYLKSISIPMNLYILWHMVMTVNHIFDNIYQPKLNYKITTTFGIIQTEIILKEISIGHEPESGLTID